MEWRQVAGLENQKHREVFFFLCSAMDQIGLRIVDKNHYETLEVHLTDPNYAKYAFASIQSYGARYVELRFPEQHLEKTGLLKPIKELSNSRWGNSSAKFVRFKFHILDADTKEFILLITDVIRKNIKPVSPDK